MKYNFQGRDYHFTRYPTTNNRSLRPLSAADELLLGGYQKLARPGADGRGSSVDKNGLLIAHDRFGVLATLLSDKQPQFLTTFASQQKALDINLANNKVALDQRPMTIQLDPATIGTSVSGAELGLMRVPKSLELFELYLAIFTHNAIKHGKAQSATLLGGFMTRHFTPALLKVAERYANRVEQSRAVKKARLLTLSDFKGNVPKPINLRRNIDFQGREYQQYYGVFSASHIDYATQFLLEYARENNWFGLPITGDTTVLDIACGNGIIGAQLLAARPNATLFAVDDLSLATLSAKMNLPADRRQVIWDDGMEKIQDKSIDLAITNPPFHFGYETNIEVSLALFSQARRVLKPGGRLIIVANRHLNYGVHLRELFNRLQVLRISDKFELLLVTR